MNKRLSLKIVRSTNNNKLIIVLPHVYLSICTARCETNLKSKSYKLYRKHDLSQANKS